MVSGIRLSQPLSDSRRSSGQTNLSIPGNTGSVHPTSPKRKQLLRTQTFDSTQSSDANEDNQLVITAHSTRSHSCVAPVNIDIRRLSRGPINQSSLESQDITESFDSADLNVSPPHSSLSSARSSIMITRSEHKRREALWDLFQSESVFLYDHLMVLKNVFMEPLKKIQVEGYAMFAEPELLFGNLDELCCVTYAFCKEFLNVILQYMNSGTELNPTEVLIRLFQKVFNELKTHLNCLSNHFFTVIFIDNDIRLKVQSIYLFVCCVVNQSSKASSLTQAYHRYTLNYINALNYLETLRRQVEFNEFEKVFIQPCYFEQLSRSTLISIMIIHVKYFG